MKPSMTLGQAAAEVIEEKLRDRDWTVAVLARRTGMDRVTLWRKINSRSRFDLDTFDAVAHAFGVSPRTLMGEVLAWQADAIVSTFTPEAQESIRRAQEDLRPKRDEGEEPGAADTGA